MYDRGDWRRRVEDMTVAYTLMPYIRDVLLGLVPLVCLSEALKVSFPFRERALLWYIGAIAVVVLVAYRLCAGALRHSCQHTRR